MGEKNVKGKGCTPARYKRKRLEKVFILRKKGQGNETDCFFNDKFYFFIWDGTRLWGRKAIREKSHPKS